MKILIVEDEKPAADKLISLLSKLDKTINILAITESVEETVNWLSNNTLPDLILMDIQLDDGICFEIFDNINIDVPVIFTTAFNEYTLQAFKVNSIDYLLKPIQQNELENALNRVPEIQAPNIEQQIRKAITELNRNYRNRFLIKIGSTYKSISVTDINFFYIESKATFIKTNSNRSYAIDYTLDQITQMVNPDEFYRINRSCLVNVNAITQLSAYSSSRLQLSIDNHEKTDLLVVSREKVSDFKNWMDR